MSRASDILQSTQQTLHRRGFKFDGICNSIRWLIKHEAWQGRTDRQGRPFRNFRQFCEHPLRQGLEVDYDKLMAIVRQEGDTDLKVMLREEGKLPEGTRSDLGDNITGVKERVTGTSKSYTLRRLQRDHPKLYDRVKAKRLSANAAAIQGGVQAEDGDGAVDGRRRSAVHQEIIEWGKKVS